MHNKKVLTSIIAMLCIVTFSAVLFIGCSGGSDSKTDAVDSSTMQSAPAMEDTSSMMIDTTKTIDTNTSTRPVKSPN